MLVKGEIQTQDQHDAINEVINRAWEIFERSKVSDAPLAQSVVEQQFFGLAWRHCVQAEGPEMQKLQLKLF